MKKIKLYPFSIFLLIICFDTNAALVSILGGQAVYDTDLNITWVSDSSLAASNTFGLQTGVNLGPHPLDSSGQDGIINSNGTMDWQGALHWIDAMNASNYLGANNWRLPFTLVPDAGCNNPSISGGRNCSGSEMGHLFYDEFMATGATPVTTTGNPTELDKFTNIVLGAYWSGTESDSLNAYSLTFGSGNQAIFGKGVQLGVWAVRDGNISAVPIPAAVWLFISGFTAIFISFCRRREIQKT